MKNNGLMNEDKFSGLRENYPLLKDYAYFDTALTGAVPDYVYNAHLDYQDTRYRVGGDSNWCGMVSFEMFEWARGKMAEMLGGNPDNLAFGENTSQMFAQFAGGLKLKRGDNVVMTDTSFMSMLYAWDLRRQTDGIGLRLAKTRNGAVSAAEICALADERTRVISIAHVENNTGFRHDLRAIGRFCRENGILFAVDAAQSAGVLPIEAEAAGIDFLAGNNYKWMQGFSGSGFGYFGSRALERIQPSMAGWRSNARPPHLPSERLELHTGARRFEYGYPNAPGVFALGLVAEKNLELGLDGIAGHVLKLADRLRGKAAELPGLSVWNNHSPENRSQIVILCADESFDLSSKDLEEQGVICAVSDGAKYGSKYSMRVGIHYFNNAADIDALIVAIGRFKRKLQEDSL